MNGSPVKTAEGETTGATPAVGTPATVLKYVDRDPVTVVEVKLFRSGPRRGQPREIAVQYDQWEVVSGGAQDGSTRCRYERDPSGRKALYVLALRGPRAGSWVEKGSGGRGWRLALGKRECYRDPRFPTAF